MEQQGMQTTLKRTLKVSDLIIYGLVFMIPLAPAAMYGAFLGPSGGMVALCYLIGMAAMFFTGMSYRIMSQKYPMAGSVYVYVQKGVSPALGFMTGWSILLAYAPDHHNPCPVLWYCHHTGIPGRRSQSALCHGKGRCAPQAAGLYQQKETDTGCGNRIRGN